VLCLSLLLPGPKYPGHLGDVVVEDHLCLAEVEVGPLVSHIGGGGPWDDE
jgi:hypothetical protein